MIRLSKTSFILSILCLYLFVTNLVWLKIDKVVEGEEAPHFARSIQLYRTIDYSLIGKDPEKLGELRQEPKQKPWNSFLFYSFVIPSYLFFGISTDVAVISSSLFHLLIAILTYLIGSNLVSKKVGLLAAAVCSLYPIIFNMSRQFSPNPAFVFFVLLAIYFILKSQGFDNRKYSILAGITTGLSLLLGYTNGTFIAAGYISQSIKILKTTDKKNRMINLLMSIGTGFIVSFWWYALTFDTLLKANEFIRLQFGSLAGSPSIFSLHSMLHYSSCLIYGQIYLINTLIALIGLIFFIIKKKEHRTLAILWIVLPYLFFTLAYESKNTRYTMPFLPILAISTSYLIFAIKRKWIRNICIFLILFHGFAVHILSGFEFKGIPGEISYKTGSKICYSIPIYGTPVWGRIKPVSTDFKVEKILEIINSDFKRDKENGKHEKKRFLLLFAPESPHFRPLVAGFYSVLMDIPVQIWPLSVRQFDYYISAIDFDYIVLRTHNSMLAVLGNTRPQMEKAEKALIDMPYEFSKIFNVLDEIELYDNSKAIILKKVMDDPLNQNFDKTEKIIKEGLNVNPESPFLHFKYASILQKKGEIDASKRECELIEYWFKKNDENPGYLFLDYKRITEEMIGNCHKGNF